MSKPRIRTSNRKAVLGSTAGACGPRLHILASTVCPMSGKGTHTCDVHSKFDRAGRCVSKTRFLSVNQTEQHVLNLGMLDGTKPMYYSLQGLNGHGMKYVAKSKKKWNGSPGASRSSLLCARDEHQDLRTGRFPRIHANRDAQIIEGKEDGMVCNRCFKPTECRISPYWVHCRPSTLPGEVFGTS